MQMPEPQSEHAFLKALVGDWSVHMPGCTDHEGNDHPAAEWRETVRALGDLWFVAESAGTMPDGTPVTTIMTLGYDPTKKAYVGSWIGTMMTHLWKYEGHVDASGKVLTLDCEGPDFENPGNYLAYQDIITIVDDDTRTLTARVETPDGWKQMMEMTYRRVA